MAQERVSMRDVYRILQFHFEKKMSGRSIAKVVGYGRTTIQGYLDRAKQAEFTEWPQIAGLSEVELEQRLGFKNKPVFGVAPLRHPTLSMPDWSEIHQEMSKPHVTLALLWTEYRESRSDKCYGYTQFCEHYKRWTKKLSVVMRQTHKAGEKAFVDYCDGLWLVDAKTNERVRTQLFVGCLGASSFTFAEATISQTSLEWVNSHVHMWEYFGGVTGITVPDNLRSGVTKPDRYEPLINETYQDMAMHYGTCIIPAWIRSPRQKAKVEANVLVAQRWILARLRNHIFTSLAEMNERIFECLCILNNRRMRHVNKSRLELYNEIDKPALKSLPPSRYEYAEWKKARANIDYHITFEHHHYSVPYQLVHELMDVRATATVIEIFNRSKRVSSHRRSYRLGGYTTSTEHMPKSHRAHAEWTPSRVIDWAKTIGTNCGQLVEKILVTKMHPEQGFRAGLGIIRLEKKYGKERVESASAKALEVGALSYRFVAELLKNKMDYSERSFDQTPVPVVTDPQTKEVQLALLGAENIRGGKYYH
jgi:transposase